MGLSPTGVKIENEDQRTRQSQEKENQRAEKIDVPETWLASQRVDLERKVSSRRETEIRKRAKEQWNLIRNLQ